ncbi:MAG: glycosyl hydrolase [Balneolaceae bacterium]|nr:glycosyl hydrolase [Balneolaceae bacterium]
MRLYSITWLTFDTAFADRDLSSLRSFFNDSYEVDDAEGEANWTPNFFEEFEQRRGYDLKQHLPALPGDQESEQGQRVLTDYRETISDLLLEEFTLQWDAWADEKDAMVRNQAHGSPANILDLYAASDIPETEGTDILRAKMASSAANVTGKPLISAEAATWLNEHFRSNLADVKKAVDRYFLSGVNHMVYHGTAYSPSEETWPGWLFYAAVHFNERNPFWDHFSDFNSYVARTQSFLTVGSAG